MCSSKTRISNQINPQRSWTIRDTDLLESQRTLVWECFNWNFQKDRRFIMFSMKTFWHDVWSQSLRDSIRNQHHYQQLLIRRKNTKLRKLGSIENKVEEHNISCIRRATEMNMTNGLQKQGYLMQKRWLKIIRQNFQVKTYKKGGKTQN